MPEHEEYSEPDELAATRPPSDLDAEDFGPHSAPTAALVVVASGSHTIRSHRVVEPPPPPRGRWLLLVTAVLVLGTGGVLAYRAIGSPPTEPPGAPRQPFIRTPVAAVADPASPSMTLAATGEPSPAATVSPSASPGQSPPSPSSSRSSPAPTSAEPTTTTSEPFVAITLEAEGGTLSGDASPIACVPCSGGSRVRYIMGPNAVAVSTTISQPGTRTIRVTYETDGSRELKVQINGVHVETRWVDGTSWEEPRTFQFSASIAAGPVELRFYNDTKPAPDIDAVTIS